MGFFDDLGRNADLWLAVNASRDDEGMPNIFTAYGMALGMGHTSDDEKAMLGAILASQGAFDKKR